MKERFARVGVLLVLIVSSVSLSRAQVEHQDLKSGKIVVHKLLVIPPQASVTKSGMKGSESLVEESRIVETALPGLISKALQANGCMVLDDVLTQQAMDKNQDLKYAVADVQGHFDTLYPHIEQKPKDVKIGRYTMGDDVVNFSPGAAADALIFTRAAGVVTTGGKKAFAVVVGGNASDFVVIHLTVVDSQTGNVLYYAAGVAGGNFLGDPNRMGKPIEKSLKGFPCSGTRSKKK